MTGEVGGRPVFSGDGRVSAEPSDRPGWERGVDGEGQNARAGARDGRGDGAKNGIMSLTTKHKTNGRTFITNHNNIAGFVLIAYNIYVRVILALSFEP